MQEGVVRRDETDEGRVGMYVWRGGVGEEKRSSRKQNTGRVRLQGRR